LGQIIPNFSTMRSKRCASYVTISERNICNL
jgi:hypothetical protein